jgi:hypothetical protein
MQKHGQKKRDKNKQKPAAAISYTRRAAVKKCNDRGPPPSPSPQFCVKCFDMLFFFNFV